MRCKHGGRGGALEIVLNKVLGLGLVVISMLKLACVLCSTVWLMGLVCRTLQSMLELDLVNMCTHHARARLMINFGILHPPRKSTPGKVQMGALTWWLKATLGNSCTIFCNCAHLWPLGPFAKGFFVAKS